MANAALPYMNTFISTRKHGLAEACGPHVAEGGGGKKKAKTQLSGGVILQSSVEFPSVCGRAHVPLPACGAG